MEWKHPLYVDQADFSAIFCGFQIQAQRHVRIKQSFFILTKHILKSKIAEHKSYQTICTERFYLKIYMFYMFWINSNEQVTPFGKTRLYQGKMPTK